MDTIKNCISYIADIITIVVAIYGIGLGLSKKTKTLTGFKINYYVSRIFKTGIIIFVSSIIFQFTKDIILSMIRDNSMSLIGELTNSIFIITLDIFLFWLIVPIIWTSSFMYTIEFINLFLPNSYKINTQKFKNEIIFRIDKAIYGRDNKVIDVTDKLQRMINNNLLEITASNALAGDPFPDTIKDLIIDYTVNGVTKREIIKEHDTKIIPN
ncbi:MAG: hypothetical protein WC499_02200 [Patescibacteria group bacterium]